MKIVSTNRKAKQDYQTLDTYTAGIQLKGMEVKSLRTRGCSLNESFARIEGKEAFLHNMYISEFDKSSYFKIDPRRKRKLLLHKQEIKKLIGATTQKGLTLIPLKLFFNENGLAKIEIALAKGRRSYDKRKKLKEEVENKETKRELKKFYKRY